MNGAVLTIPEKHRIFDWAQIKVGVITPIY
jgi:hypothetical protein